MAGEKILVVDDERSITELLKLHLTEEGYSVQTAQNVDAGLKIFAAERPDLVILDITMPGKDGFDFLKSITTRHGRCKVPVVVMTARDELKHAFDGIDIAGFLEKPFEFAVALKYIQRALSEGRKTVYLADVETGENAQRIAGELMDERYQVFFVRDLEHFRQDLERYPPHFVVMEYIQHSAPGELFLSSVKELLAVKAAGKVPVIVYTYSGMDFREKSLKAGATVYLGRPDSPGAVVTAIRELEMK